MLRAIASRKERPLAVPPGSGSPPDEPFGRPGSRLRIRQHAPVLALLPGTSSPSYDIVGSGGYEEDAMFTLPSQARDVISFGPFSLVVSRDSSRGMAQKSSWARGPSIL